MGAQRAREPAGASHSARRDAGRSGSPGGRVRGRPILADARPPMAPVPVLSECRGRPLHLRHRARSGLGAFAVVAGITAARIIRSTSRVVWPSGPSETQRPGLHLTPGRWRVPPCLGRSRPFQCGELTHREEQGTAVRSHRWEVTASWCSPRTVCTSAAALAKARPGGQRPGSQLRRRSGPAWRCGRGGAARPWPARSVRGPSGAACAMAARPAGTMRPLPGRHHGPAVVHRQQRPVGPTARGSASVERGLELVPGGDHSLAGDASRCCTLPAW
jgi:hypothetical protein